VFAAGKKDTGLDDRRVIYRHEFKYIVDEIQLAVLENELDSVMQRDRHTGPTGRYQVRSLYFDDLYNTCFLENEEGTEPREKFRIRIYNGSTGRISLECKRKQAGKTLKTACLIPEEIVRDLMNGEFLEYSEAYPPLLRKLCILSQTRFMAPKVIVEYDRVPYICDDGNVRVTLDTDIRASGDIASFLDRQTVCRPVMPVGSQLLEVKYDQFLPDYIYRTVQAQRMRQTTFSKYYLCRKLGGAMT